MPFSDCIDSALEQGALSPEEAAELKAEFDRRFAQRRLELGDGPATAAAKDAIEAELRAAGAERRRRIHLADAARNTLKNDLIRYRRHDGTPDIGRAALEKLSHYGTGGSSSVRGRMEAIVGLAHSELADHIRTFRRSLGSGRRFERPLARDIMRELHGDSTGNPAAKALAEGLANVAEKLRQRFNAAGGAIPRLENWGWTHQHDRNVIARAGREAWKDAIRPRLAPDKMVHPLTGEALDAATLDKALDVVYENIVSDSWSRRRPTMQRFGIGAIASQRADARFLVFKSADDWLAYDDAFGGGDPVAAWFSHIKEMGRDIAAMEILGPNPGAMIEWMKQVVRVEIGKAQADRPSLARRSSRDAGAYSDWRLEALYEYLRGRPMVSSRMAGLTGDIRNVMTSALLGASSVLAAATDPFIDRAARRLAGLPTRGTLTAVTKTLSGETHDRAVRSGFIAEDFLHIMKDEVRYAGFLDGHEWSRWLADRAVTWNFLKPLTESRRHIHQLEWQATLADHADSAFGDLPPLLRQAFAGFGIDQTDWDVMRSADLWRPQPDSAGFLRPVDIVALAEGPGLPKVQKLLGIEGDEAAVAAQVAAGVRRSAEKYVEMVMAWSERAVPSGTPNARSFVTGAAKRGTIAGELLEGVLQFKSFVLSFSTLQVQALAMTAGVKGGWSAARYAGALAIGMSIGGGIYVQLKDLVDGKDPQDVRDPRFWIRALLTGGGLGIFGDFLFAEYARNGHNPLSAVAGPGVSFAQDVAGLTLGNLQEFAMGEDTHAGREFRNFLGRYTPVLSTHWATRLGWNRLFLDQLQYLTDPNAHQSFRSRQSNLRRETGQSYYWPPGRQEPARAPDFGAAIGQ